jgi:hypothetical protein
MNPNQDKAYKLAASFYLSSIHKDWSGERIKKAILADEDSDDEQAIEDQKFIEVWQPIKNNLYGCHPMARPMEELDDLIQGLADAFMEVASLAKLFS